MQIAALMQSPATTVSVHADRDTALRRLDETGAPAVILTDDQGLAHGAVTRSRLAESDGVANAATPQTAALEDHDHIDRAKDLMIHHRISVLPVLRRGRPIGLLTRDAILDFMRHGQPAVAAGV